MDPAYEPPEIETRQVYGISMQQRRNDCKIDANLFKNVVTKTKEVGLPDLSLTDAPSSPNPPLSISSSPPSL